MNFLIFLKKKNFEDKDKKELSTLNIVLISVIGFIVIVVVLFFILKFCRKKSNDDFEKLAKSIPEEKLMNDIN